MTERSIFSHVIKSKSIHNLLILLLLTFIYQICLINEILLLMIHGIIN